MFDFNFLSQKEQNDFPCGVCFHVCGELVLIVFSL